MLSGADCKLHLERKLNQLTFERAKRDGVNLGGKYRISPIIRSLFVSGLIKIGLKIVKYSVERKV